jgi:hypothetical protein
MLREQRECSLVAALRIFHSFQLRNFARFELEIVDDLLRREILELSKDVLNRTIVVLSRGNKEKL